MCRIIALCLAAALGALRLAPRADAQQAGAALIATQMMRIVEARLERAGVELTGEGPRLLRRFVAEASEDAYDRNDLAGVVPRAERLADRLAAAARKASPAEPRLDGKGVRALFRRPPRRRLETPPPREKGSDPFS